MQATQMLEQYGDIFHYTQDPVSGNVIPVSGPADTDKEAIPNSTTVITPITFGDLVKQGIIKVTEYLEDRVFRELVIGQILFYEHILPATNYPITPIDRKSVV